MATKNTTKLSADQIARAHTLWIRGSETQGEIAAKLGVSRVTLNKCLRAHSVEIGYIRAGSTNHRKNSRFVPAPNGQQCVYVETINGSCIMIDFDDVEKFRGRSWSVNKGGYAKAHAGEGGTKTIYAHRLVMPGHAILDHRNGNKLDCRKANLRPCTQSENEANKPPRTGKFKGVRQAPSGRWAAIVSKDGKTFRLGTFDTDVEAAIAYDKKAKELWGEFAYQNIPW